MADLGDRLLVLLLGGTAVGGLLVGWAGAFAVTSFQGEIRSAIVGGLVLAFLLILAGIWRELQHLE